MISIGTMTSLSLTSQRQEENQEEWERGKTENCWILDGHRHRMMSAGIDGHIQLSRYALFALFVFIIIIIKTKTAQYIIIL